jgi:hypothetical protein
MRHRHKIQVHIDVLNSHSNMWGNSKNDESGNSIEMWVEAYLLNWIHS